MKKVIFFSLAELKIHRPITFQQLLVFWSNAPYFWSAFPPLEIHLDVVLRLRLEPHIAEDLLLG